MLREFHKRVKLNYLQLVTCILFIYIHLLIQWSIQYLYLFLSIKQVPLIYHKIKSFLFGLMHGVKKGVLIFRSGSRFPAIFFFPAAGKHDVRENSSHDNHVTNKTLAHFFCYKLQIVFNFKIIISAIYWHKLFQNLYG